MHAEPSTSAAAAGELSRLLRHCQRYMPDGALKLDYECVVRAAPPGEIAKAVYEYCRARIKHPTFKPNSYTHNNHAAVIDVFGDVEPEGGQHKCEVCSKVLPQPRRGQVPRTCSAKCRKIRSRAAEGVTNRRSKATGKPQNRRSPSRVRATLEGVTSGASP